MHPKYTQENLSKPGATLMCTQHCKRIGESFLFELRWIEKWYMIQSNLVLRYQEVKKAKSIAIG